MSVTGTSMHEYEKSIVILAMGRKLLLTDVLISTSAVITICSPSIIS